MADGNIFKLVEGVLSPVNALLDGLFYAGALYGSRHVVRFSWNCLKGLRTYLVPYGRFSRKNMTKEFGKWVLITCGTSGIGLAFAHEFAKRKMNVVLISRSYDDLVSIVSDLQTQYSIQVLGIHADFCLGQQVFQEIEEALQGYEIGILVNNIAIRYDHPQYFALVPHHRMWQLLSVNVTAPCVLSHMILPQMLERRKGVIINVCSNIVATPPTPLSAGYSACMSYVDTFSQTLHHENKHRGIFVQTLLPCYVTTPGMSPSIFTPTPHTYVQHAIRTLGVSSHTCGYWPHALQSWAVSLIPRWIWIRLTMYFNSVARKRCLREAQQKRSGQLFSRKRQILQPPPPRHRLYSGNRHHSELTLRRTPSPHRRVSTIESPNLSGKKTSQGSGPTDPVHRLSLEETSVFTPQRTSTGSSFASIHSPIPEDHMTSTPLHTPETGSQVQSGGSVGQGGFRFSTSDATVIPPPTLRSSSASSADSSVTRSPVLRRQKYSRVLVVPSVATVTFVPQSPRNDGTGQKELGEQK